MTRNGKIALAGLALVVAAAGAALLLPPEGAEGEKKVARVTQDGKVMAEIDLAALTSPRSISIPGENGAENVVLAEHGRVCMERATCPDQICVQQGWISDGSTPIVCLPNKVMVEIVGGEDQFDAVTK